jgi:hypothetical protein
MEKEFSAGNCGNQNIEYLDATPEVGSRHDGGSFFFASSLRDLPEIKHQKQNGARP